MKRNTTRPIHYTPDASTKYRLSQALTFQTTLRPSAVVYYAGATLETSGRLRLAVGFAWDGPSGPCPDLLCLMPASAAHDALCMMIQARLLPKSAQRKADRLFYRIAREDGTPLSIALVAYVALRLYDRDSYRRLGRALYRRNDGRF